MLIWSRAYMGATVSLVLFLALCPQTAIMDREKAPVLVSEPVSVIAGPRDGSGAGNLQCLPPTIVESETGIVVEEDLHVFSSGPALYLLGRIRNTTDLASELILVSWETLNKGNEPGASADVYLKRLNPGESKPFKLMLPLGLARFPSQVRVRPGFKAKEQLIHLQATVRPYADRGQAYVSLLGEVTNHGGDSYDFIKVIVEFLDREGKLLDIDWAFLNYLGPGESDSFTVYTSQLKACQWRVLFD
ncbi:MAG TPA: FxLYD domain-containing protein [bacterium]|nr:FxLYD domain-containing protein [bacterium]